MTKVNRFGRGLRNRILFGICMMCFFGSFLLASDLYWIGRYHHGVMKTETGSDQYETVFNGLPGNVSGIQIDHSSNYLYYSISSGYGSVNRIPLGGGESENLISGNSSYSFFSDIDLDVANGKLYYSAGRQNGISRANLDGTDAEVIVPVSGSANNARGLKSIELDLINEKLYWSVDSKLLRSNLDGSNVENLFTTSYINDFSLDIANDRVFFSTGSSMGSGRVMSIGLDGSGVKEIARTGYWPTTVAYDYIDEKLYWADTWYAGPTNYDATISYFDFSSNSVTELFNLGPSTEHRPFGMQFDPVPEPASMLLFGLGAIALRRRK